MTESSSHDSLPVSSDGHLHGRVPAVPAEHLRRDPLPQADVGRGDGRSPSGAVYRLHLLLLRESLTHTHTHLYDASATGITISMSDVDGRVSLPTDAADSHIYECHRYQWSRAR